MFQGFFINLRRSEQRRERLIRHLTEVGAGDRYQRFEAVDGKAVAGEYTTILSPGQLGCWLSFLKVLSANRSADRHVHIIEDDIVLASKSVPLLDFVLRVADEKAAGWDLLFTDFIVPPDLDCFLLLRAAMDAHVRGGRDEVILAPLRGVNIAGNSSVIVNKRSVGRVADLIDGKWSVGIAKDLYVRRLINQGTLKAYATIPFLTTLSPDSLQSDIRGKLDQSRTMFDLFRLAFYKDADLSSISRRLRQCVEGAKLSPQAEVFLEAARFRVCGRCEPF